MTKLLKQSEQVLNDVFGFQIKPIVSKPDTVQESGALNVANASRKQRKNHKASHYNLQYIPETDEDKEEMAAIIAHEQNKTDKFSKRRQAERSFLVLILISIFLAGGRIEGDELNSIVKNYCKVSLTESQHPVFGDISALLNRFVKQKMLYKQKVSGAHSGEESSYIWHAGTRAQFLYPKSALYKIYKEMLGDKVSENDGTYKRYLNAEKKVVKEKGF